MSDGANATRNTAVSIFAGMAPAALQAALASAQAALIALQSGSQVATVTYAQGEGNRSVTYRKAEIGGLTQLITELQACLGIRARARAAFRPSF